VTHDLSSSLLAKRRRPLLGARQYEVVTDEELVGELMFPVHRRVATVIFLPADAYQSFSIEMVNVDPADPPRCVVGTIRKKKMKYQRRNSSVALPREAREVSDFNDLSKSLGRERLIAFQYVSASPPKLLRLLVR
jgi:hypothetical protein